MNASPRELSETRPDAPRDAARELLLERELARYVQLLAHQEGVDRLMMFGSLATGDVHTWSDIDLVVIQRTDLPFLQRLRALRSLLQPQVGTDIFVYTPEEFDRLQRERAFVRDEMVRKGVVLYERDRGTLA